MHCLGRANGRTHRKVYAAHLLVDDERDFEAVTVGSPPNGMHAANTPRELKADRSRLRLAAAWLHSSTCLRVRWSLVAAAAYLLFAQFGIRLRTRRDPRKLPFVDDF